MTGQWHVEVDADTCMASGVCRGTLPELFVAGGGKGADATVVTSPTVAADERVLDAAASCPVEAITVTDLDTGQTLEPLE